MRPLPVALFTILLVTAATASAQMAPFTSTNPAQLRVNEDHNTIDRLSIKLERDTRAHAERTVIRNDKAALKAARKQLRIDRRACTTELRANPHAINPQLRANACK